MPALTIPNTFTNATTAVASEVNANFTAVSTLLNSTKLDADNLQDGAVTAAKIGTNAVTGAKLNSDTVDNSTLQYTSSTLSIKDSGVTTAKINDSAVTTAKINNGAVTQAKLAAVGQQISSSCSSFSSSSTSFTDVTNLSVTITSTGRPVMLLIQPDGNTTNPMDFGKYTTGASADASIQLARDGTGIAQWKTSNVGSTAGNTSVFGLGFCFLDTNTSAATYTYKVQVKISGGSQGVILEYAKLVAFEL